jgi:hypothetical protein
MGVILLIFFLIPESAYEKGERDTKFEELVEAVQN